MLIWHRPWCQHSNLLLVRFNQWEYSIWTIWTNETDFSPGSSECPELFLPPVTDPAPRRYNDWCLHFVLMSDFLQMLYFDWAKASIYKSLNFLLHLLRTWIPQRWCPFLLCLQWVVWSPRHWNKFEFYKSPLFNFLQFNVQFSVVHSHLLKLPNLESWIVKPSLLCHMIKVAFMLRKNLLLMPLCHKDTAERQEITPQGVFHPKPLVVDFGCLGLCLYDTCPLVSSGCCWRDSLYLVCGLLFFKMFIFSCRLRLWLKMSNF